MEEEKKGFVVKDKRFSSDDRGDKGADKQPEKGEAEPQPAARVKDTGEQEGPETAYLPEVNFYNFVVSLSTTALYHFGDFEDPAAGKKDKNLPAVKEIIDTLAMLQHKTEGNLEPDEKNLIEGVLFELRMRYVKEST